MILKIYFYIYARNFSIERHINLLALHSACTKVANFLDLYAEYNFSMVFFINKISMF
jgi:hypothetical protein